MKRAELWNEDQHGLGFKGSAPRAQVEQLESTIWSAAIQAQALGVPFERFCELCEAAMDVAEPPNV
jgi:hypothetical protein